MLLFVNEASFDYQENKKRKYKVKSHVRLCYMNKEKLRISFLKAHYAIYKTNGLKIKIKR